MKKPLLWWLTFLSLLIVSLVGVYIFKNDNTKIQIKGKEYSLTGVTINLASLWIIDNEIAKISSQIDSSLSLETIYLWGNQITEKGLKYLSLLKSSAIKVIDLSNNKTGDAGMKEFLEKSSFRVVDISGNTLTDISVQDVINNKILAYLTVNNNSITDNGFQKILENKNIEYLSIENNLITDASIDYIVNNKSILTIKHLKLRWNKFSSEWIKKLDTLKVKKLFETLSY